MSLFIADTGFIVALLDRHDKHHEWAASHVRAQPAREPYRTCEAALTEASHLVLRARLRAADVMALLGDGSFVLDFDLATEQEPVTRFLQKYSDQDADLADACVVRMSELNPRATVLTIDRDFYVYRREDGSDIPVNMPERV